MLFPSSRDIALVFYERFCKIFPSCFNILRARVILRYCYFSSLWCLVTLQPALIPCITCQKPNTLVQFVPQIQLPYGIAYSFFAPLLAYNIISKFVPSLRSAISTLSWIVVLSCSVYRLEIVCILKRRSWRLQLFFYTVLQTSIWIITRVRVQYTCMGILFDSYNENVFLFTIFTTDTPLSRPPVSLFYSTSRSPSPSSLFGPCRLQSTLQSTHPNVYRVNRNRAFPIRNYNFGRICLLNTYLYNMAPK